MATNNADSLRVTSKEHQIGLDKSMFRKTIPLLALACVIYFVDRKISTYVNASIAIDVGISATAYGLGAGLLFISYARVKFSRKLITNSVGVGLWLTVLMIVWVLLSSGVAFVQGETSFYIMRLLLGAVEAGILAFAVEYLTNGIRQTERTCAASYFLLGVFAANIFSNPIGRSLIGSDVRQDWLMWLWVLVLEGLPYAILAYVVWTKLGTRTSFLSLTSHERAMGKESGSEFEPALDMLSGSTRHEKYSKYRNITIDEAFGEKV